MSEVLREYAGSFRGAGDDVEALTFDAACAGLHLSTAECLKARDALDGDVSALRELAVLGLVSGATAGCAKIGGPVLAGVCASIASKVANWVINLFQTMGAPGWFCPWAGVHAEEGEHYLRVKRQADGKIRADLELARGFATWPEAKAVMIMPTGNSEIGRVVVPARSYFWAGDDLAGYIDYPLELVSARCSLVNAAQNRGGPVLIRGGGAEDAMPAGRPTLDKAPMLKIGHHRLPAGAVLLDVLNNAIPPELRPCGPGEVRVGSRCLPVGVVGVPGPRESAGVPLVLPLVPKTGTSTGVKVAVGIGAGAAALILLPKLFGR